MEYTERLTGYIASNDSYKNSDIIIIGVPMDYTVSYRPGSRSGPQQIRTVSYGIEEFSFYCQKDLRDYSFYDAGDISLPFGNVSQSLNIISKVAGQIIKDNKFPIYLGGEHLITWPIVNEYSNNYPELALLHFDAHADLRKDYLGEENSHATVIRKICEKIGGKNVYQFGIRSGDKEEFEYAKNNTNMYINEVLDPLKEIITKLKNRPVYITIDIDVVDPAFAPGTGTPEPGGCTSKEILDAVLLMKDLNVVGIDVVEVSPMNDHSDRTALLAAKLVREIILNYQK
ncbi:agmatinase [Desulfonispora thiosulfatigenes DSM 11270]|uniref:Agmatinase n=1 Tax=Desulfonispora thiosulfatigenes DSM 11270 TaxID=656914 RepID=A0A1W1VRW6_DESTI|nr:agmatinase [Desulfonispora thiosulfatigenes]SMB96122.1 agmatinase [Desulfonispora thiosulfatigenes DSM 11270]